MTSVCMITTATVRHVEGAYPSLEGVLGCQAVHPSLFTDTTGTPSDSKIFAAIFHKPPKICTMSPQTC